MTTTVETDTLEKDLATVNLLIRELTFDRGKRLDAGEWTTEIDALIENAVREKSRLTDRLAYRKNHKDSDTSAEEAAERGRVRQRQVERIERIHSFVGGIFDPLIEQVDEAAGEFYKELRLASEEITDPALRAMLANAKLAVPFLLDLASKGLLKREGITRKTLGGFLPTIDLLKTEPHK
jgi:hypothetical protein